MNLTATVWAVRLEAGRAGDVKGSLSLEDDALVFTLADGSGLRRIPFSEVQRARRLLGSPVLVVEHADEQGTTQTAFYFTQPPPLEPTGRMSRRKLRRQNVGYLGVSNREKKEEVRRWQRAVRDAAKSAGGST